MSHKRKILIAAAGTGGHLFPAQAFAEELKDSEILFVGGGLSSNRCFQKELFPFQEISTSPLRKKGLALIKSLWAIVKGVKQSFKILREFQPSVVVGFGSFHSFPMLLAALCKRVPIVLFESNSEPGIVNRLFSRWAVASATQFALASKKLSGKVVEVRMPLWKKEGSASSIEEARAYFSLDPHKKTLLVFGGSQGAASINNFFCESAAELAIAGKEFQVIHIAGNEKSAESARRMYARLGIPACVKEFENRMSLAWRAASLVVCRSGAATLSEQIAFEVPGILIPYPYATEGHQRKNAQFMEKQVGGAMTLLETDLDAQKLKKMIEELIDPSKSRLEQMSEAMRRFKSREERGSLSALVLTLVKEPS